MKLLFYLTRFPGVGGIENVTQIISDNLIKSTERGGVFIISHIRGEFLNGCKCCRATTLFMPQEGQYDTELNRYYLDKLLEKQKFDAIIYQDSYAPTEKMVVEAASKHHIPLFVFEHNSPAGTLAAIEHKSFNSPHEILKALAIPFRKKRILDRKRYLLKNCRKYIVLAPAFIDELIKLTGYSEYKEKVDYIYNPYIPKGRYNPGRKENIILFVGRLERVKRVDLCLKYWEQISRQLPDWRFVIVGDGREREVLESYVKDKNLERVSFEGYQNPDDYFDRAKIFWLTSDYEGWGMSLIEAMSYGNIPIARTSYSALDDIVQHGINGFKIPKNDIDQFKAVTVDTAINYPEKESLARNAADSVSRYNINKVIRRWYKLLNEINNERFREKNINIQYTLLESDIRE